MFRIFLILFFISIQNNVFSQMRYKNALTLTGIIGHTYVRAIGINTENWKMKFAPTYGIQGAVHKFAGDFTEIKIGVGITAYKNVLITKEDQYKANYLMPYLISLVKRSFKNYKNIYVGIIGGIQPAYPGSYKENLVNFHTTIIGKKYLQVFCGPMISYKYKDYNGFLYEISIFYQYGTLSVGELILEKNHNFSHFNSNGSYIGLAFSIYKFPWKKKLIQRSKRKYGKRPECP